MPYYSPSEPYLQEAQKSAYDLLASNRATEERQLSKYLQRYGSANPEYLATASDVMGRAEDTARLRFDANMAMTQLREKLMRERMNQAYWHLSLQRKAQKEANKNDRWNMYGSLLGSLGMIGGGIVDSLKTPSGIGAGLSAGMGGANYAYTANPGGRL